MTAIGSRRTSTPFTASNGRLSDEMPVAGSEMLKPSSKSGVSYARAPPSWIRPSGPLTTEGSSGNDSRAFMRDEGRREMLVAVSVLPSSGVRGEPGANVDATTLAESAACSSARIIRSACPRGTRAGSNPLSDTEIISPGSVSSNTNRPSPSVEMCVTTRWPSSSSTVAPGSGSPV